MGGVTIGPERFALARKEFWTACQKRAGTRQAIVAALAAAGGSITEAGVGRWVRGENDPGLEITMWAARQWDISLDEMVFGQPQEARIVDQLAELRERLELIEQGQAPLLAWAHEHPRFTELVTPPEQADHRATG